MAENPPQNGNDRVINTPEDMVNALADQFVTNADAGNHAANDEMVEQILAWKRNKR